MLDEIHKFGEPIFPEDLKIDANDLIEAGICDRDKAQKILNMLRRDTYSSEEKHQGAAIETCQSIQQEQSGGSFKRHPLDEMIKRTAAWKTQTEISR